MKLPRTGFDWLLLVCAIVAVPAPSGWRPYAGELSARGVLIVVLAIIGIANTAVIFAIRARNKREGLSASRSLILAAIGLAFQLVYFAVTIKTHFDPRTVLFYDPLFLSISVLFLASTPLFKKDFERQLNAITAKQLALSISFWLGVIVLGVVVWTLIDKWKRS